MFNPFPLCKSIYGAPMGRRGDNPAKLQDVKRLHCRHQGGGQGYDRGGAYFGLPSNVYAVWAHLGEEIIVTYVRASSREAAIAAVRAGDL